METLSITEVCRRTGLSTRSLRFYEARGLLGSQRSAAGQRRYGAAELARLHQITALKGAAFTLARIGELLGARGLDLAALIDAQLSHLAGERAGIDEATRALTTARAALERGQIPDLDSFCDIIKQGAKVMSDTEAWKKVTDRYFSPEEQAHWTERKFAAMPPDFDQDAYSKSWSDLSDRVAAALPTDPAGPQAQAFVAEWQALLAPFTAVASPEMMSGASKLYDRIGEWSGEVTPPFTSAVWDFIKTATAAGKRPE